jgi:hypothetical protein
MREAVMSPAMFVATSTAPVRPAPQSLRQEGGWNPEDFAREQIRGLVRKIFFPNVERSVSQVVFSAAESETEVLNLCWRVGEALALETTGRVALVGEYPQALGDMQWDAAEIKEQSSNHASARRRRATRVGSNLWLVPPAGNGRTEVTTTFLQRHLGEIRAEFEYSIIAGPAAADSNAATSIARLADGIVLVLSARHTRRMAARKIKEKLQAEQACLLGTVLSDRVFPIPERIYRRL